MARDHHKWDYLELPATDMDKAKAFYTRAFGWTFEDWGPDYAAFVDTGLDGGIARVAMPPPRGGPIPIIYSTDLEASAAAIIAAGGAVIDHVSFPGGERVHFTDPSGVELAVWTRVEDGASPP